MSLSVGFLDEDEGGALDYGRARADEGDTDVLDLAFPGTSRRLKRSLDDVLETMDAPRTQASTEGVQWELAVQLHASVLDEIQRFSLLAEPVGLEAVDDRGGEAVVDLRHVDVFRREARSLPGEARRAAAALHVAAQAPDASRDLERQPLTVAGDIRGARPQVARAVGDGEDDGDRALHRDIAVVETERVRDHPGIQVVLSRERHLVEVGVGVHVRVPALGHGERRHLLPALVVPSSQRVYATAM